MALSVIAVIAVVAVIGVVGVVAVIAVIGAVAVVGAVGAVAVVAGAGVWRPGPHREGFPAHGDRRGAQPKHPHRAGRAILPGRRGGGEGLERGR